MLIHVVAPGETLFSIAALYSVPVTRIIQDNELNETEPLVVGQTLVILYPDQIHIVLSDETLTSIAASYGVTVNEIFRNNPVLRGISMIYPGQRLIISYQQERLRDLEVNGYAYPFINHDLLRQTMPYLTYITPFTHGITNDGELIDLDDAAILNMAKEYGVKPLMHLSTLTENEGFSDVLSRTILNNPPLQDILIQNILQTMAAKGYYGLDLDFEFIQSDDRVDYIEFVRKLTDRLNAAGYPVMVALAPKTSRDQPGLLYEGHDYAGLGEAADAVLIMTYEWGYTYGPPMAVSPLPNVRAVINYAVTEIPPDKIFMGMPNYGYNWTLPYIQGESVAMSISNVTAVDTARLNSVSIQFDPVAYTPYFRYQSNTGTTHEVWFDDARSIEAKLALTIDYDLQGISYWNLMRPFPQNWRVLNALYRIVQ